MLMPNILLTCAHNLIDQPKDKGSAPVLCVKECWFYPAWKEQKPPTILQGPYFGFKAAKCYYPKLYYLKQDDWDIAIVKLDESEVIQKEALLPEKYFQLEIITGMNMEVNITGYPMAQTKTAEMYTSRNITMGFGENSNAFAYMNPTAKGNSGSPVYLDNQKVVGVHIQGHTDTRLGIGITQTIHTWLVKAIQDTTSNNFVNEIP